MKFENWGEIDYEHGLEQQLERVERVLQDSSQECIVLCSHPPVVTLGKKTEPSDLGHWSGKIVPVQRGGRATYHGPGQVVVYPILDLNLRQRDLHLFLRNLEEALIATLKDFDVKAEGNKNKATGVWVGEWKLASIGIAVKRWISYHGLAVNLYRDPLAFQGINPCGFSCETMVSLEDLLGKKISREEFSLKLQKNLHLYLRPTVL